MLDRIARSAAATLAFAAAIAVSATGICAVPRASAPEPIAACSADVALTVDHPPPDVFLFTWTPVCGIARITVAPVGDSTALVWSLRSDSSNLLPTVRYGVAGAEAGRDAVTEVAPRTLAPGTSYTVRVYRGTAGAPVLAGRATFAP